MLSEKQESNSLYLVEMERNVAAGYGSTPGLMRNIWPYSPAVAEALTKSPVAHPALRARLQRGHK